MSPVSAHAHDFAGWRSAARALLQQDVPPNAVEWVDTERAGLFTQAGLNTPDVTSAGEPAHAPHVRRRVLDLL